MRFSDELLVELLGAFLHNVRVCGNFRVDELEDPHPGASHLRIRIHCRRRPHQLRFHLQNGTIAPKIWIKYLTMLTPT